MESKKLKSKYDSTEKVVTVKVLRGLEVSSVSITVFLKDYSNEQKKILESQGDLRNFHSR
jgi:hypothetical protein